MINHENIQGVNSFIIASKINGLGYRKIATALLSEYGIKISHTAVAKYYKEHLGGAMIDSSIVGLVKNTAQQCGAEIEGEFIPLINEDIVKRIRKNGRTINKDTYSRNDYKASQDVFADLYGKLVGLMAGNFDQHIQGKASLNIEYIKYLKELRAVYNKPFKA